MYNCPASDYWGTDLFLEVVSVVRGIGMSINFRKVDIFLLSKEISDKIKRDNATSLDWKWNKQKKICVCEIFVQLNPWKQGSRSSD
jgi:hypothetical protein